MPFKDFESTPTPGPKKANCQCHSEFLTTGFVKENGDVIIAQPERGIMNCTKIA